MHSMWSNSKLELRVCQQKASVLRGTTHQTVLKPVAQEVTLEKSKAFGLSLLFSLPVLFSTLAGQCRYLTKDWSLA